MSNEFKLVPVEPTEEMQIESLKKQLQESTALAAPLQAEIERLKARCDENKLNGGSHDRRS